MKILMINKFFYPRGGSETYLFELSAFLRQNGHEVMEFSMQDEKNQPSDYSQFFIKNINFSQGRGIFKDLKKAGHLLYSLEAQKKLEQLISQEKPDIAHLHNFNFQLTPSILKVLNRHKIPVVWTLHDYKAICPNYRLFTQGSVCERCKVHRYYNCFVHKCFKNSWGLSFLGALEMYLHKIFLNSYNQIKYYIAPSKFLEAKVLDWKLPRTKVKQLYYALDLSKFKPGELAGQGLLYIGRLEPEKGILALLEAIKTLPNIELSIAGKGSLESEIKRQISAYGLDNRVKMLGQQSSEALRQLISNSKLVIVPSLWYENNPLVILEAFAMAKPVIGSDLGGIPELVKDGQTGFLFKAGDADDLAKKISSCYYNDSLLAELGQNARKWLEENCSPQKHLEEILKIYNEVISLRRRS